MKHLFVLAAALFCIVITWYQSTLSSSEWFVMLLGLLLTVLLPIASSQYLYSGRRKNLAATLGIVAMMCALVLTAGSAATTGQWYASDREPASCIGAYDLRSVEQSCASMNVQASSGGGIFTFASNVFLVVLFLSIINLGLVIAHFIQRKKTTASKTISSQKFVQSKPFWLAVAVGSVGISFLTFLVPTPAFTQPTDRALFTSYYGVPFAAKEVVGSQADDTPCMIKGFEGEMTCHPDWPHATEASVGEQSHYSIAAILVNIVVWLGVGSLAGWLVRQSYRHT